MAGKKSSRLRKKLGKKGGEVVLVKALDKALARATKRGARVVATRIELEPGLALAVAITSDGEPIVMVERKAKARVASETPTTEATSSQPADAKATKTKRSRAVLDAFRARQDERDGARGLQTEPPPPPDEAHPRPTARRRAPKSDPAPDPLAKALAPPRLPSEAAPPAGRRSLNMSAVKAVLRDAASRSKAAIRRDSDEE